MYRTIEPYDDPGIKMRGISNFKCEMNVEDHGFICGLIKEKRPNKILEIGVAEGGTTAVVMSCLEMLDIPCNVYSIDLCERLFYNHAYKTGYKFEQLSEHISSNLSNHQFLLGKSVAYQMDKIGYGIELAIIDTTHRLPGEIMEFLCIFPYLSENAVVILHDVDLNFKRAVYTKEKDSVINSKYSVATKVLFSTVTADKYIHINRNRQSNVAAFIVTQDTKKYIIDLFYVLTLTWEYIPTALYWKECRKLLKRYYESELIEILDLAMDNNKRIFERRGLASLVKEEEIIRINHKFPYSIIPFGSKIVLYGAGIVGKESYFVQKKLDCYKIVAWVDKNYKEYQEQGLNVENPQYILHYNFDFIVIAVEGQELFESIKKDIDKNGWSKGKTVIGPLYRFV